MLDLQSSDLNALLAHVAATLPPDPAAWPGGWPDQIEAALIDAVLSIRARYGSPATGVRRRVRLYLAHRGNPANDLTILAASDPQALATVLDSKSRTGGQLKPQPSSRRPTRSSRRASPAPPTSTRAACSNAARTAT